MYPYVVKTEFYDEYNNEYKKLNCLVYANNISDVSKRMIKYCDPEHIEIDCVGDDTQLFEVSDEIADALVKGEGVYENGIESEGDKSIG